MIAHNSVKTVRGNPDKIRPYRWQKGQPSPNPGGRPKTKVLSEAYRLVLADMEREDRPVAELIARAMARKALRGDVAAAKEMADRTEGKPIQAHSIQTDIDEATAKRIADLAERLLLAEKP